MAWTTATPERLGAAHRHMVTVSIETPDGTRHPVPALRDGALSVTFDESTAPYATATASLPATSSTVDLADPLNFSHLVVDAGYEWETGYTDTGTLCRLPLLSRNASRPADRIKLTAGGVESLAQQYHLQWHSGALPLEYQDTFAGMYDWLVSFPTNQPGITVPRNWPPNWYDYAPPAEIVYGYEMNIGDNLWSLLDELGSALERKVYGDEMGAWAGRFTGNTDATTPSMRIAPGSNLLTADATIAYGDFYNAVVDRYRWTPYNGEERTVYGRAYLTSGPYSARNAPVRVKYTERPDRFITQSAATAAATRRVRNLAARRNLITVEAVADYRIRPKHRIDLRLPSWTTDQSWIVQAVTFTPATGGMKLTLRRPIDDTATVNTTGE